MADESDAIGRARAFGLQDAAHPFLQQVLVSIDVGVVAADSSGGVLFLNPIGERLTGWPLAEAKGRRLDLFSLGSCKRVLCAIAER